LQTAAKPLQIATLLLLTAYRNLPTPIQRYHRRPSTTYRLATIQTLQTDDRQTDRTLYHKRDRTTQYGRLKTELNWTLGDDVR